MSYQYNQAKNTIETYATITRDEVLRYLAHDNPHSMSTREHGEYEKKLAMQALPYKHGVYLKEAEQARQKVIDSGKYPYNTDVATVTLEILGQPKNANAMTRMDGIVYYTNSYIRDRELIKQYDEFVERGYIHIEDIDESFHGKKALLTGAREVDFWSITKNDEPVTLVCKDRMLGYRKPRMRTRYCAVGVGSDYFVKVTA